MIITPARPGSQDKEDSSMAYNRSRTEHETIISFDAEERTAHIYTADPVYLRKLDKLHEEFPDAYTIAWTEPGGGARKYLAPSVLIRFGKPQSEAQREARRRNSPFSAKTHTNTSDTSDSFDEDE